MRKRKIISWILSIIMVLSITMVDSQTFEVKAASAPNRIVGYFPYYRMHRVNSIDFSAMTHCILAFMTYEDGMLTSRFAEQDVQTVISKCQENNVKVLIGIGGWGGFDASDDPFGSAEKRTKFVDGVMAYVNTHNLDGVDIDIELEDACIWDNFDSLISELSSHLKSENKILTMAVAPWFTDYMEDSTFKYFDFLNLMAYDDDMSGNGEVAPWSQVYDMVSHYQKRGADKDKLVIGVPFYGYGSGGAAYSYREIVEMNPEYAYLDYANGIHYNGMNTIREKAEYSKEFGGTMIWEVSHDSFGTYSLLKVIKDVLQSESEDIPEDTPSGDEENTDIPSKEGETYNITYHLNGGKNNKANPLTYLEGSAEIVLQAPAKTGYTFSGWYGEESYKTKVTKINTESNKDIVLYAKWTPNKYTIRFHKNGATGGTMKELTNRKYGNSYTLSANKFKRKGYTFEGWNTRKNGTGTNYKNKASIKSLTSQNGKIVTLYAQWEKDSYKITYKLNGGINHSSNLKKYDVTTKTTKLKSPTKKGYTFKGWYSDKNFKKKVTRIKKGSTGNITLYAKWVKK